MSDSYKIYASQDYVDSKALPEGATAHQQLVTDGEGAAKWEEKLAYKEVTEEILLETTFNTNELIENFFYLVPNDHGITKFDASGNYVVTWNGVVCPTYVATIQGMPALEVEAIEEGLGGQIVLGLYGDYNNFAVAPWDNAPDVTHTVQIIGPHIKNLKTLDPMLIPDKPTIIFSGNTDGSNDLICDHTAAEIWDLLLANDFDLSKVNVVFKEDQGNITRRTFATHICIDSHNTVFAIYFSADAESEINNSYSATREFAIHVNVRYELISIEQIGLRLYEKNGTIRNLPRTIPEIQSAQIGQTIVVKSVDENGKPTKWEAVDINEKALPLTGGTLSGDLYANGFYVNSPSIYPSVTFSGTVDEELEKFGMVEFHENHRGSIVSEMQDGSYKEYYQFPRPADTGTENAYYDVLTTKNPSESLAKLGGLPLTGGTLSGDLKLTGGTNQRKINIYRNIGDSQYELQHSVNYEGKGFLGVYKNSKEINTIKLGENSTEFSKPITVSGGATGDVAAQTRENLGITDGIPVPTTATVGQTVVVKAVDENGKPTEWETANTVKSINGAAPDEAGNVDLCRTEIVTFSDYSKIYSNPNYVMCTTHDINGLKELLNSINVNIVFSRTVFVNMDPFVSYVREYTGMDMETIDGGAIYRIYFGDDLCPMIINTATNKITTDPDWTAPEEVALKSDIPTDEHINELISTALSAFTNGEEVSY